MSCSTLFHESYWCLMRPSGPRPQVTNSIRGAAPHSPMFSALMHLPTQLSAKQLPRGSRYQKADQPQTSPCRSFAPTKLAPTLRLRLVRYPQAPTDGANKPFCFFSAFPGSQASHQGWLAAQAIASFRPRRTRLLSTCHLRSRDEVLITGPGNNHDCTKYGFIDDIYRPIPILYCTLAKGENARCKINSNVERRVAKKKEP